MAHCTASRHPTHEDRMNDIDRHILNTADSLLLVIDLQERLAAAMDQDALQSLIRNVAILLDSTHELGLPVLVTEQYVKGLGPTLPALKEKAGHASFHEKISFSCCGNDDFMAKLKATGKRQIIVCGTETHVCVQQTVLDLLNAGYSVHVVKDAVMSRSPDNRQTAIEAMTLAGAIPTCTETVVFQWLKVAGTETFRKLSKLVK